MPDDRLMRCAECGTLFVWTAADQAAGFRQELCPVCRRLAPADGRARGLVKWFSRAKGYGFIVSATGPELFVHKSGLAAGQPLPRQGQLVEYSVTRGPRGAQAEQVVVLELP